jgi:hypothetical protein
VRDLPANPYDTSDEYFQAVVEARLEAGDLTMAAAHAAMLHTGARGYHKSHSGPRLRKMEAPRARPPVEQAALPAQEISLRCTCLDRLPR